MKHVHDFVLLDTLMNRYRCWCGVLGRRRGSKIVAFICQHVVAGTTACGRSHCGADAVFVRADRNTGRCAEHLRRVA